MSLIDGPNPIESLQSSIAYHYLRECWVRACMRCWRPEEVMPRGSSPVMMTITTMTSPSAMQLGSCAMV